MQMLAVYAKVSKGRFLLPGGCRLRLFTYRDLLLRLTNTHNHLHAWNNKCTWVLSYCGVSLQRGNICPWPQLFPVFGVSVCMSVLSSFSYWSVRYPGTSHLRWNRNLHIILKVIHYKIWQLVNRKRLNKN